MQYLINRISEETGVPEDHVSAVIAQLSVFVKEKYPLLATTVDTVLAAGLADKKDVTMLYG